MEALNAQFESIRGGDITALPNVQVLFTNLQQAKSHLNERDTSETRFLVELAKYKLEQQRNNPLGGTTNEVRRYANLINARNQLRFEIQLYAPTITDYKTLLAPEAKVPYPLQGPVQNYKNALKQHADEVMVWVRRENRSSVQLLDEAQYEKNQENRDPFIWEGRAEVLQGRVELINSHIVQQFDTFFTTYQQVMESAFDTTCKELFPDRFEKGFLNAIVRHIIWAWETVFGSSDTENRESKMALARLLYAEGAQEKPQTSSKVNRILYTAQVLTDHLAKDSANTLKEARTSFNSSVRDVLAGESLAHYFPETVSN
ncbi:MAG: hypothetical protein KDK59_11470, partial [Simkania sp.]|nr:hypothetical protein [Simkania sp.]